ncbi:class I SAM-dependent methyltransferase [Streptomyces sp. NPDC005820]|uniref:class I SAM-dependent DNA methyltransferase n=1 Tax=Streptomyces sp. NPDC005820 TaxID=3157069 RepID=UPI003401B2A6
MVDTQFSDSRIAALYDLYCPWDARGDFTLYLPLVMAARSVLDVGCGTGALLRRAREDGHTGRLCGLDPATGMLEVARTRPDIEWILGDLTAAPDWDREFDLVVMTGHAFQVLLDDAELRAALTRIAAALTDRGSFAFEIRNPLVREWEDWRIRYSGEVVDPTGTVVHCACEVETPVRGDRVAFTHTDTGPDWTVPHRSRSVLRFLAPDPLSRFLTEAGLVVSEQYGDWDRSPGQRLRIALVAKNPVAAAVMRAQTASSVVRRMERPFPRNGGASCATPVGPPLTCRGPVSHPLGCHMDGRGRPRRGPGTPGTESRPAAPAGKSGRRD